MASRAVIALTGRLPQRLAPDVHARLAQLDAMLG
jgi:hypothetical protein